MYVKYSMYVKRKTTVQQLGAYNSREHPIIRGDTLQKYLSATGLRLSYTHQIFLVASFIACKTAKHSGITSHLFLVGGKTYVIPRDLCHWQVKM